MEKTIVNSALRFLNNLDHCKAIKIHGSVYQERGTPDVLCCYHGLMLLFEFKQPGEKPSELQKRRRQQWSRAGARVFTVDRIEDVGAAIIAVARGIERT